MTAARGPGGSSATNQGERGGLPSATAAELDAATRDLVERDAAVFLHQALSTPVANAVVRAEGCRIHDAAGRSYLDLHGNGVHTVGYHHPAVVAAIEGCLRDGLLFAPRRFTNLPAVRLAEKLVSVAPAGLGRVLMCPGGSEAVEMAVMLAKLHTGRWKTLAYHGTFHGAGFQAVSVGADPHFRDGLGPLLPGALHLELPDPYRNPWGWTDRERIDAEYVRQLRVQLEQNPDVAAVISEAVFYNSTVPTRAFWEQVRELCTRHGVLLIFDEIYTAFGRTGAMFAAEHFVTPDILVVGKGFGGAAVPFAGILAREELNSAAHKSIGHYTHEKNPLCCAVATAVIETVEREGLVQRARDLGRHFLAGLEDLQAEFECVGNVTGLGLNLAVDLVTDRESRGRDGETAARLLAFAMERGVSFKLIQGNVLNLKPPLVISRGEIDEVLGTLRHGLRALGAERPRGG